MKRKRKFDLEWYLKEDRKNWVLPEVLKKQAKKLGNKPFLQFGAAEPLSFRRTNEMANKVANALIKAGVKKGEKVTVLMPNSDDYVIVWFGILKAGAVMVPANTAYKADFLQYVIDSSDSKLLFIAEEYLDRMSPIAKRIKKLERVVVWTRAGKTKFDRHGFKFAKMKSYSEFLRGARTAEPKVEVLFTDYSRLMFTSGTTGLSKGVMRPCAADYSSARNCAEIMDVGPDDVYFTCLPLFHSNAMVMTVYPALIKGAKTVVEEKYSASRFWKWMNEYKVTRFNTVGTVSYFMWNTPPVPEEKTHGVGLVLGSPAPHDIIEKFMKRFNIKFMEGYGLTETGQCTWMRPGEPFRVGSCGKEAPGYEIKIADPESDEELPRGEVGQIIVRPRVPNIMLHYYNKMPEKTVEDFRNLWFHTGDAGWMDKDGYIYFMDRVKDYIRRRGENISSFEVEKVVSSHPAVKECAAVGVKAAEGKHAEDEVMIVIVPEKGAKPDPEKIVKFLEPKMPNFMIPRFMRFVKSLPKTGTERVQKNKLREKGITGDTWGITKGTWKKGN